MASLLDPGLASAGLEDSPGRPLTDVLADLPRYALHGPAESVLVTGLAAHTKAVRPGALFACVPGTRHDGHRWAPEAVRAGASALLVAHPLPELARTVQVQVPDVRAALAAAARRWHGRPDRRLHVLAVTGTNGKTTMAFMLAAAFGAARQPLGMLTTVCYRLGRREVPATLTTPDALSFHAMLAEIVSSGAHGVAMEASSHALAQKRLEGVEVDTAIFTNLSRDHLDYHGTYPAYFAAKRRLFGPRGGDKPFPALAVICGDRAAGRLLAREARACRQVVTYGLAAPADVTGQLRREAVDRWVLEVRSRWGGVSLRLPLPGRHNALNALGAIAACLANGVPADTAAHAIATMAPVPGRFERVPSSADFEVVVDFAHNPDGLRQTLSTARRRAARRVLLVFGCKGGDADAGKRRRMGEVAARYADHVYLTADDPYDEDPGSTAAEPALALRAAGTPHVLVLDRRSAIRQAIAEARPGDLVLVAGRGHETRQFVAGGASVPLDDRAVCRQALAERWGAGAVASALPAAAFTAPGG